jgi:gamma-glutamyl:cysteine ligase YbdK (ATP-grasp superfamily)
MAAFGIEHEVAFLRPDGQFADWTNTAFEEFARIVDDLPLYAQDYPQLRIGDAGIKLKRWYIEGYERFDEAGQPTICQPKGIEIRTTIHPTIMGAVEELTESFQRLRERAAIAGFEPVPISFHPYRTAFTFEPPLTGYEQQRRMQSPEKQTAHIPMLTYGPDLNLSFPDLSQQAVIDVGRKLTFYSPAIVPFSFSSPFAAGTLWDGYSYRAFARTGARPAVQVFLDQPELLLATSPSLTKRARLAAEVGRIEFKACDSCADASLYAGLLALLKGLTLDDTLPGRATVPDAEAHQRVARLGFDDKAIVVQAKELLAAASWALRGDDDEALLAPLYAQLEQRQTPAHALIQVFHESGSVQAALHRAASVS